MRIWGFVLSSSSLFGCLFPLSVLSFKMDYASLFLPSLYFMHTQCFLEQVVTLRVILWLLLNSLGEPMALRRGR